MMKLKNWNCERVTKKSICKKTQKLKLWPNSNTQIGTKLKRSNCDKTWIVIYLKLWENSNCDKTQVVATLKLWQNSNCEIKNQKLKNSKCDKTWELKLWQNSKTEMLTKLEIWHFKGNKVMLSLAQTQYWNKQINYVSRDSSCIPLL